MDSIFGGRYLSVLGKGNKRRDVPLREKVVDSIQSFRLACGLLPIEHANPEDPLFTTNTGCAYSPSYLSQYVKKEIGSLEHLKFSDQTMKITPPCVPTCVCNYLENKWRRYLRHNEILRA